MQYLLGRYAVGGHQVHHACFGTACTYCVVLQQQQYYYPVRVQTFAPVVHGSDSGSLMCRNRSCYVSVQAGVHPEQPGYSVPRDAFEAIWRHSVLLLQRGFQTGSILTVDPAEAQKLGKPWTRRHFLLTKPKIICIPTLSCGPRRLHAGV